MVSNYFLFTLYVRQSWQRRHSFSKFRHVPDGVKPAFFSSAIAGYLPPRRKSSECPSRIIPAYRATCRLAFAEAVAVKYQWTDAAGAAAEEHLLVSSAVQSSNPGAPSNASSRERLPRNLRKHIIDLKHNHSLADLLAFFRRLKEEGISLDRRTYAVVIDALSDSRLTPQPRPRALLSIWDDYRKLEGWDTHDNDFMHECILRGLDHAQRDARNQLTAEYRRKEEALLEENWSKEQFRVLDKAIRSLEDGAERWSALAMEHFRSIRNPTSSAFLSALSCALANADTQTVQIIVEQARTVFGGRLPPAMYPYVIECHRKAGNVQEATDKFKELQDCSSVAFKTSCDANRSVVHAYLDAEMLEVALSHIKKYRNFLTSAPAVDLAIAAMKHGNAGVACGALQTLKLTDRSLGRSDVSRLLDMIVKLECDGVSAPVMETLLIFDQREPIVREYVDAFVVASIQKNKAYVALKLVSLLADNGVLPPTSTLNMCFSKNAEDPLASELLFTTLLTISRMLDTTLCETEDATPVKHLCMAVSEKLVEQYGGKLAFIVMRSRISSGRALEEAEKFFSQNVIDGEEQHQLAIELACRQRDDYLMIKVANVMRKSDYVPPAFPYRWHKLISNALEKDPLTRCWWECNAPCLPSTNFMSPRGYHSVFDYPDKPITSLEFRPEQDASGFNAVLALAAKTENVKDIIKAFELVVSAGKINYWLAKAAFKACGSNKNFEAAKRLVNILNDAAKFAVSTEESSRLRALARTGLAIACIAGGDFKTARGILTYMTQKENLTPSDVDVFAEYLKHATRDDDNAAASAIYEEVGSLGLRPGLSLYNSMLAKYGKARKTKDILNVIQEMREQRIKPTVFTYCLALNAAARISNEKLAAFIFHEAQLRGIRGNVFMYNGLMQFYLEVYKNRAEVEKIWKIMTMAVEPDSTSYAHVLFAFACLLPTNLPKAISLFKQIKKPDGRHYASIICGYAYRLQDFATAEAWINHMDRLREATDKMGPPVNMYWLAYGALISSYCAHGNVEAALQVRRRMLDHGRSAEHVGYANASILRGCAYRLAVAGEGEDTERYVRLAEDLFKDMHIKAPSNERSDTTAMVHSNTVRDEAEVHPNAMRDKAEVHPSGVRDEPEVHPSGVRDEPEVHPNAVKDEAEISASTAGGSEGEVQYPSMSQGPNDRLMILVYLLAGLHDKAEAVYRETADRRPIPSQFVREAEGLLLNRRDQTFLRTLAIQNLMPFKIFHPVTQLNAPLPPSPSSA